jgi:hypothetical protein
MNFELSGFIPTELDCLAGMSASNFSPMKILYNDISKDITIKLFLYLYWRNEYVALKARM